MDLLTTILIFMAIVIVSISIKLYNENILLGMMVGVSIVVGVYLALRIVVRFLFKDSRTGDCDESGSVAAVAAQGIVNADSPAKSTGKEENHEVQEGKDGK
jgi:hypothetical protein